MGAQDSGELSRAPARANASRVGTLERLSQMRTGPWCLGTIGSRHRQTPKVPARAEGRARMRARQTEAAATLAAAYSREKEKR
jgi:hypothetical protein